MERPVDDLPERVRGVGAEVARLGLAREERVHCGTSLCGSERRERAVGDIEVVIDLYVALEQPPEPGLRRQR